MVLVDTSILIAYLANDSAHASVHAALSAESRRWITPAIRLELASALSLNTRIKSLSTRSARLMLDELDRQTAAGVFAMREIETQHFQLARQWVEMFQTPLRTLDALHLACASDLKATMLTGDVRLAKSAAKLKVRCTLIGKV
jgi:uncharacterized protein